MVPERVDDRLRVAIVSPSEKQRDVLQQYLESNGLEAVAVLDSAAGASLGPAVADVLLVNLAEDGDTFDLDALLDRTEIPILFNDADIMQRQPPNSIAGRAWGQRLAEKLQAIGRAASNRSEPSARGHAEGGAPASLDATAGGTPERSVACGVPVSELLVSATREIVKPAPGAAQEVWVLAASIGGPQAVTQFVQHLPAGLPVAFVVAQHIGLGFVDLLASQLARVTPLTVRCGEQDMILAPGEIAVAPVEQRFGFSQPGRIALAPDQRKSIYSPCIDDVMLAVADGYGARAGAVVFSGMGSDGVAGGRAIAAAGGAVFAQEPDSCVVSSMADGARDAGIVSFSGTPAELARHFLERFGGRCDDSIGG